MNAPHKFDFDISCVNKEVKVFGRKQQKIKKIFNHTAIINMSSYRKKEWITKKKPAQIIKKFQNSEVGSYGS